MTATETELLRTDRFVVVDWDGRIPTGADCRKTIIRHPGAVVILPRLDNGQICLIENFRPAVGRALIELPAGTRETLESPEQTARRELIEETGFTAERWRPLNEFYMSPGIMDERMFAYVAEQLTATKPNRQLDESINNRVVSLDTALTWIDDGRIEDAKTIAVLLRYDRLLRNGF